MKHIIYTFLLSIPFFLQAQVDTIPDTSDDANNDFIEDIISQQVDEAEFELNTIFEDLDDFKKNRLDLNKASAEDFALLRFLSDIQINDIISHRKESGDFISIYELQSLPSMDLNTIIALRPYIKVKAGLDDYNVPIWEMLYKGKNEVFLRWDRVLEEKKGYTDLEEGSTAQRYLGDPNRFYIRYRHQYENRLSYGFTLEKDPGEEFFTGSQKKFPGFDYASGHFFLRDINKTIKGIALGDFAVNMGQGLVMFDGFGGGKSSFVMNIKKSGRPIRPYTSVSEALYKRGAALNFEFGKHIELMAYGSYRKRDGNFLGNTSADTVFFEGTQIVDEIIFTSVPDEFTSIQESGFHRTPNELEDKNAFSHLSTGGTLKFKGKAWHIAANAVYDKFDQPLNRNYQPYNQFFFNGDQLLNGSLDYSYVFQNYNFFGETAVNDAGGIATTNGLIIGLDRKISMSVMQRYFNKKYHALYPNEFAETSAGRNGNETGLYLGLEIKPNKHWIINGYFDAWRHPWLRFSVDAPSKGNEYLARVTYKRKRKMETYLQFRQERKERNTTEDVARDYLVTTQRTQFRIHIANKLSKALELRSRAEFSHFKNGDGGTSKGFMIYQDIIFKPLSPLHFTTRFAIFDTDDFDSRIYAYENDILNSFSIPAFFNRGGRFYVNLRYRGIRNMTMELRFSQTYFTNQETFGSGLEEIAKPRRSEVKAQIKYKF